MVLAKNKTKQNKQTYRPVEQNREKKDCKKKKKNRAYGPVRQYLKVKHTGNWSLTEKQENRAKGKKRNQRNIDLKLPKLDERSTL